MNITSAWSQLAPQVLSAGSSKKKLLTACFEWYAKYKKLLDETHYQLDALVSLNFEAYVNASDVCSLDEAASIRALTLPLPKQRLGEAAARRLRDAFEVLLAVKNTTACVNCGETPLYAEKYAGGIYWVCSVCGQSQAHGKILKLNLPVHVRLATPREVQLEGPEAPN